MQMQQSFNPKSSARGRFSNGWHYPLMLRTAAQTKSILLLLTLMTHFTISLRFRIHISAVILVIIGFVIYRYASSSADDTIVVTPKTASPTSQPTMIALPILPPDASPEQIAAYVEILRNFSANSNSTYKIKPIRQFSSHSICDGVRVPKNSTFPNLDPCYFTTQGTVLFMIVIIVTMIIIVATALFYFVLFCFTAPAFFGILSTFTH